MKFNLTFENIVIGIASLFLLSLIALLVVKMNMPIAYDCLAPSIARNGSTGEMMYNFIKNK